MMLRTFIYWFTFRDMITHYSMNDKRYQKSRNFDDIELSKIGDNNFFEFKNKIRSILDFEFEKKGMVGYCINSSNQY